MCRMNSQTFSSASSPTSDESSVFATWGAHPTVCRKRFKRAENLCLSEKWTSHEHAKKNFLSHPIIFKSACGQDELSMRFSSPDSPTSSDSSICHCIDVYSTLHHNSSFFLCNSLFPCYRCYNVLTSHQVDFQYSILLGWFWDFSFILLIIRLQGERTASREAPTEKHEWCLKGVKKEGLNGIIWRWCELIFCFSQKSAERRLNLFPLICKKIDWTTNVINIDLTTGNLNFQESLSAYFFSISKQQPDF